MAQAARVLLYALLVWAPLPLGSNRPVFWVVNGIVATVILALFVAGELTQAYKTHFDWRPATFVVGAFALWTAWIVFQALPGLPQALQHPIWGELAADLPKAAGTISINPSSTWTTAAQVIPVAFLVIVAMRLAHDERRAQFLLEVIVATAVGVAVYGLIARFAGFNQPLFVEPAEGASYLTGTFVARNAAATYFVLGLAAAASLLLTKIEQRLKESGGQRKTGFLDVLDGVRSGGMYLAGCLVLSVALVNTGSRGGVIAGAIALLCATLFWALNAPISRNALAGILGIVAISVVVAVALSSDLLVQRLESGVDTQGRLLAFQDTIDMILARPWLGHGAGTFVDAFPLYHDRAPSIGVWNAAHNSYLQLAADLGIPVATVILASGLAVLLYLIVRLHKRTRPAPAAIAAVAAAFAVGFHASVDFSVQFQSVGLTLLVMLGAGLGEGMVTNPAGGPQRRAPVPVGNPLAVGQRETVMIEIPVSERAANDRSFSAFVAPPAASLVLHGGGLIGLSRTARAVSRGSRSLAIKRMSATGTDDAAPAEREAIAIAEFTAAGLGLGRDSGRLALVNTESLVVDGRGPGHIDLTRDADVPVYVFGDVHGRLDLVERMRDAIVRDRDGRRDDDCIVVGLGDYVDRGPDSHGVVEALAGGIFGCRTILLRGNHEQMLLDFLDQPEKRGSLWYRNGAIETLRSYGVDVTRLIGAAPPRFRELRHELVSRMPAAHIVLLEQMPTSLETARYFFAHAGARPGLPLREQSVEDLMWIRRGFSDGDAEFEKVVVHGHTPVEKPYFGEYRVNLDTGAYFSNRLTCLVLEGDQRRLLEV